MTLTLPYIYFLCNQVQIDMPLTYNSNVLLRLMIFSYVRVSVHVTIYKGFIIRSPLGRPILMYKDPTLENPFLQFTVMLTRNQSQSSLMYPRLAQISNLSLIAELNYDENLIYKTLKIEAPPLIHNTSPLFRAEVNF